MKKYQKGDNCVLRGIVNNQVWMAQSVIVVQDKPKETVLLLLPGAECALPEGYWRWRINNDFSHGSRWQEAKSDRIVLRKFAWLRNRVLMFLEPEKYYSCFLFWDHESNKFGCYYVNFQIPYKRSHCGFDTYDLDLDIVIDTDFNWEWKDETEYRQGILEGGIIDDWVRGIEQSKPEVFERIEKRLYPFDGSWLDWQPDHAWACPSLPDGWQIV
ncbi:MAG: DUF402 domain-containing protein [Anaerolineales bacterium]|nr:DUF402 domain-containing protein [Anaerolineales bacterium]